MCVEEEQWVGGGAGVCHALRGLRRFGKGFGRGEGGFRVKFYTVFLGEGGREGAVMSYPYPGGSAPPDGGYGGGYGYPYAPPYGYLPYPPGGGYPMAPTGAAYGVPPHAGGGVSRMPPPYNMQPQPQPQSSPHPPQRKVARPCAFFLRGQCKKRDLCNFIHDYASLPQGEKNSPLPPISSSPRSSAREKKRENQHYFHNL